MERAPNQLDPARAAPRWRVHLCFGPNCTPRGSQALLPVLHQAIAEAGLADEVEVIASTCRDRCDYGPSMNVYPGPTFYNLLTAEAVQEIVAEHLAAGRPVDRWFFRPLVIRPTKTRRLSERQ
ncbi:MAG: (2Fe-2S) ferredoxin domain-containing protein [Chloroflexia bacterium]|nr:(2Fe-2S) ferredoxin domain-containing protein [Chloroflexia bacterium]MDQ3411430.1 (2Fe-2S) ferredoxin domain-containing protein [Chloroflexota bacterium]